MLIYVRGEKGAEDVCDRQRVITVVDGLPT